MLDPLYPEHRRRIVKFACLRCPVRLVFRPFPSGRVRQEVPQCSPAGKNFRISSTLYEAAADQSLWEPFIEQLGQKTGATSGALLILDYEHEKYSLSTSWRMTSDSVRLYQEHYHSLDIWAQRGLVNPTGYVLTSQSICPLAEIKTTEIYNDYMLQAGIEHGMFSILENNKSCAASVSLYRHRSRKEFSESNVRVLRFLAPHLRRAFKLHFQLSEAKAHSVGMEAAFDALPTGIVLLDASGDIVFMNRSAAGTTAESDGLLVTGNQLRAERSSESQRMAAMVKTAVSLSIANDVSAGGAILISRRTRPPLQLVISPIRNTKLQTSSSIAAVTIINDPLRSQRPSEQTVRVLYGLTPAECRVALLLSDGHGPGHIAEMIGVTKETVRSQIKSIYCKTGVRRQSELVRLLLNHAAIPNR